MKAGRFLESLHASLAEHCRPSDRVVVAVSGGADSVALLRGWLDFCKQHPHATQVATFDHQLRAESTAEAEFVRSLAESLGVRVIVGEPIEPISRGNEKSLESAARRARYAFLTRVACDFSASLVLTAHSADDQVETVLFRLARGTGLAGLAGIPRRRPLSAGIEVLRPMLDIRRREIETYLAEIGQPFVEDPTNRELRFTRNRIRHDVLPLLRSAIHPAVDESLLRLSRLAREQWEQEQTEACRLAARVVRSISRERAVLDCSQLRAISRRSAGRILREVVQQWGGSLQQVSLKSVEAALAVAQADGPKGIDWPGGISIRRLNSEELVMERSAPAKDSTASNDERGSVKTTGDPQSTPVH